MYKKFLSLSLLLCLTSTFNGSVLAMENGGSDIAAANSAKEDFTQQQRDAVFDFTKADSDDLRSSIYGKIKNYRLEHLLFCIYGQKPIYEKQESAISELVGIFKRYNDARADEINSLLSKYFEAHPGQKDSGTRIEDDASDDDEYLTQDSGLNNKDEEEPNKGLTLNPWAARRDKDLDAIFSHLKSDQPVSNLPKIKSERLKDLVNIIVGTASSESEKKSAISQLAERLAARTKVSKEQFEDAIRAKLVSSAKPQPKENVGSKIKHALGDKNNRLAMGVGVVVAAGAYAARDSLKNFASGTYDKLRKVAVGTKDAVVTSANYLKNKAVDLKNGNLSKKEVVVGVAGTAAVAGLVYDYKRSHKIAGYYNCATTSLKNKCFWNNRVAVFLGSHFIKASESRIAKFFVGSSEARDYRNTYKAVVVVGALAALYKLTQKYRAKKQEAPAVRLLVSFEDNNCDSAGNPCEMSQDLVMLQTKIAAAISCRDVNALRTIMDEYRDMLTMEQLADCEATISDMQEVA